MSAFQCPVCGFSGLMEPPWSATGSPSYEICPSCGFEFGVTDDDEGYTVEAWRERWISGGMQWWSASVLQQPKGWDAQEQLATLPRSQ